MRILYKIFICDYDVVMYVGFVLLDASAYAYKTIGIGTRSSIDLNFLFKSTTEYV